MSGVCSDDDVSIRFEDADPFKAPVSGENITVDEVKTFPTVPETVFDHEKRITDLRSVVKINRECIDYLTDSLTDLKETENTRAKHNGINFLNIEHMIEEDRERITALEGALRELSEEKQ